MKKAFKIFILALIVFLPVQALLAGILEYKLNFSSASSFWITHWYEPFLALFFISALSAFFHKKNKINPVFCSYFIYIGLALFSVFMISIDASRGLEGFRFAVFPILLILPVFIYSAKDDWLFLSKTYLAVSIIIAAWGLIEHFFLFDKYWSFWNLVSKELVFGYGWHTVVGVKQIASFIGGPNQLASYLLPAIFILIGLSVRAIEKKQKLSIILFSCLVLLVNFAILLTYSRSAFLGLLVPLIIFPFFLAKKKLIKVLLLAIIIGVLSLGILIIKNNYTNDLITHGGSQLAHSSALKQSIDEIKNRTVTALPVLFFGKGLGTAGPSVLKYGDGLVSESWYLQLVLELGLIGLLAWLTFVSSIIVLMFKTKKIEEILIGLTLVAISITSLFLHTWADNPAMSYTAMILLGCFMVKCEKAQD